MFVCCFGFTTYSLCAMEVLGHGMVKQSNDGICYVELNSLRYIVDNVSVDDVVVSPVVGMEVTIFRTGSSHKVEFIAGYKNQQQLENSENSGRLGAVPFMIPFMIIIMALIIARVGRNG